MQELERLLESQDIEIRIDAVEKLKGKPSDITVELLLKAMKDVNWRVRKTAVEILLGEYQIEKYINGLISLLYLDDNAGARNSAIEALIRLNKKATPFLMEAFNTDNRDVRKFIIDVLGEFRDKKALPLMLNAIKDDDDNVRASAVEHLGKIGDPAVVDALIGILESGDLWTAYPAADALGRIGDRRSLPHLIKALSVKTLREPVLRALSRFSDPDTLQNIIPLLEDTSKTIQEEALKTIKNFYHSGVKEELIVEQIKKFFGERSIDMLVTYAWSSKPEVRISAILLLGLMKDERALEPLLELSTEEDLSEDVKRALVFIGRHKPEAILELFDIISPFQKRFMCSVAGEIASPIFYGLFEKLIDDEEGHVRSLAAIGISKLDNIKAVEVIKKLLSDPYEDVQEAAVIALSNLKEGLSVDEFIKSLNSKDPIIRKNSVLVLGEIGAADAVSAIGFALKDEDINVRRAVVKALSLIKTDESIRYLKLALTDENPDIRASAALSLSSSKRSDVLESLVLLLSDTDDSVRVAAIKAIGRLGDRNSIPNLVKMLSDTNGFVVTAAIDALSTIGSEPAKDALLKMLSSQDKEIRRTAIKALSPFDGIEENLLKFLNDDDWATRMAVVEVIRPGVTGRTRSELELLLNREDDPIVRKAIEEKLNG